MTNTMMLTPKLQLWQGWEGGHTLGCTWWLSFFSHTHGHTWAYLTFLWRAILLLSCYCYCNVLCKKLIFLCKNKIFTVQGTVWPPPHLCCCQSLPGILTFISSIQSSAKKIKKTKKKREKRQSKSTWYVSIPIEVTGPVARASSHSCSSNSFHQCNVRYNSFHQCNAC